MNVGNIIMVIGAIIIGFYGFNFNRAIITLFGFVLGFQLGMFSNNQLISIIMAIVLGFMAYKLYLFGIFLLCGLTGYILCGDFGLSYQVMLGIIVGVVVGIIGVKFTKPVIIISTSVFGAFLLVDTIFGIFNYNNYLISNIISIIMMVFCMMYQFKMTK